MSEQGEYNLPKWSELESEIPQSDHRFHDHGSDWLPKTDWSRDGIIASDD